MSNAESRQAADGVMPTVQLAEAAPTNGAQALPSNQAEQPTRTEGLDLRIPVHPGETVTLPPPFDADHDLAAKEGHGNLAIKVGNVTVILEGYVDASRDPTHPVTVMGDDEKPIDIATVLASTDPNLDIQTAAGPAVGPQNTEGHLLTPYGPGPGLGGLFAVGPLDQTALSYGLIDATIRQEINPQLQENANGTGLAGSAVTVDEAALPSGSNPASKDETTSGFVTVVAPIGLASITIDGKEVDLTHAAGTTIAGTHGDLTVTGWDAGAGKLDYSYTLTDNLIHPPIQGRNLAEGEDFTVVATDKQGGTASGDIVVNVIDDLPTANADCALVCRCGDASGNVLGNDVPGADGIAAIIGVTDGTHVYQLNDKGQIDSNDSAANYSYDAASGVLHIAHTSGGGSLDIELRGNDIGHFDYHQGQGNGFEDFAYTVIDGDGDKSTADLTTQVSSNAVNDQIFAFDHQLTVEDSWLLANDRPEGKLTLTGTESLHQLVINPVDDSLDLTADSAHWWGTFDYTVGQAGNPITDTASVVVSLLYDPAHRLDESAVTSDAILIGDVNDDLLIGGSGNDVLVGEAGKDTLEGNAGNDRLIYDGEDRFDGGAGTDQIAFEHGTNLGFDAATLDRFHSIEVLDFRNGAADHLGSTAGTALTAEAVLDMTDGKGDLWIAGDSGDSVTLGGGFTKGAEVSNATVADGIPDGHYASYSADFAGHTATLHIETQVATHT